MKKTVLAALAALTCIAAPAQELRLTLEECREMALQNNSSAVGAALDLEAARYQKQEAFAEYFPRVSAMGFGFWAFDPLLEIGVKDIFGNNDFSNNLQGLIDSYAPMYGLPTSYTTLSRGYLAGVSVMQPIFAGGRIVNGNRLAALGVEAAGLQQEVQRRSTSDEIEGYWWQVVSLQEKRELLAGSKEFVDTLFRDVTAAYEAGLVTEDELLQVKLARNELLSNEVQLDNGLKLAKMNLLNSIGQGYTVISANASEERPYIDSIVLADEEGLPGPPEAYYVDEESIAASMEETRLLELQVEAAELQKKMALGEALPQLAVGATYGYYDFTGKGDFNGLAFATVQIPISDWGKTSAKMKRLQTQVDKAASQRDYLQSQIILGVRQSWIELNSAWSQYQLALDSEAAAEASFGRVERNYEAGMVTAAELLQSQTSLRQASDKRADALNSYRQALRKWLELAEN
ncbi:MAG TPA: TolC family protein [Candidatus Cryptobacteroides excrementigallinarum]|nr:TolC family protein [Candidatus Cryptobacteroides excrementigallinarum]